MSIIFLLDESTSMSYFSTSYIDGINSLINKQKIINPNVSFTMITFSESIKVVYLDINILLVPEFTRLNYRPFGCTALYDAIGNSIKLKENDNHVIMIIMSDGEENFSKKFNINSIKNKIQELSNNKWEFIYIATNQDVKKVGNSIGISTCITYSESNQSILKVIDACNIAIGHSVHKLTGISNKLSYEPIPTDVSDILNSLQNCKI
jgi:hypothetical protein